MKANMTLFGSRVARRIFVLFILCALIPVGALSVFSVSHVAGQLQNQSQEWLRQAGKSLALTVTERLMLVDTELKMIVSKWNTGSRGAMELLSAKAIEQLDRRLEGLVFVKGGKRTMLSGQIDDAPDLTASEMQHLGSGKAVLSVRHRPGLPPRIFMSVAIDPARLDRGVATGSVEPGYLWGTTGGSPLPRSIELCILDASNNVVYSSHPVAASFLGQITSEHAGEVRWNDGKDDYLGSYRAVFLKGAYHYPRFTVILSESMDSVLGPVTNFRRTFVLIILAALSGVLLLSISQIRRSLMPLEKLQEATARIARRDFRARLAIESGDEFENLATSFNWMATRLGNQFSTLTAIGEIDRAILSTLDPEEIVRTLLARIGDVIPCGGVSVTLVDRTARQVARTYARGGSPHNLKPVASAILTQSEIQALHENPETIEMHLGKGLPHYLAPLISRGFKSFLVLPLIIKQRLFGIICLGYAEPLSHAPEDLARARRLADQVGVAFSNASLIEELDQLNIGTLTALARAIDATSPWTAGHSERVTRLSLRIAEALGLSQRRVQNLHRGGLLHDIGKIGVPDEILNKPGKLSSEELARMRSHVELGARILEPIGAYRDILPIVRHHHEWYDGTGYPDGLIGEEIDLSARICAVADCFDALTSDRPYRGPLDRERAIEYIKNGAGRQFDPNVVRVFATIVDAEGMSGEGSEAMPTGNRERGG